MAAVATSSTADITRSNRDALSMTRRIGVMASQLANASELLCALGCFQQKFEEHLFLGLRGRHFGGNGEQ